MNRNAQCSFAPRLAYTPRFFRRRRYGLPLQRFKERKIERNEKICNELKKKGSDVGGNLLQPLSEEEKEQLFVILDKIIKAL